MPKSRIAMRRAQAKGEGTERYQARRDALIAAAAKVFAANGYRAASLDEIASLAEIDRASLYYYVENKKELFYEVVKDYVQQNTEMAEAVLASDKSAREKLELLIGQLLHSYERHYPSLFVFIREDLAKMSEARSGVGKKLHQTMLRFNEITVEIIESGMRSGEFRSDIPANVAAFSVIGMVNWTHRWFKPGGGLTADELGKAFAGIACDGLMVSQHNR
jgi:TetR/AcrR family transcriptional regulator, cholesterol catabolism regulator